MKKNTNSIKKGSAIQFFLLSGAIFISILLVSATANCGDPDIAYHTLKTDHFNIHYDKALQKLAERAAVAAENAYTLVTSSIGWKVEGKVEVRIVDSTDYANGLAAPYRYPFIQLYATPPDIGSALQENDDWLFSLILHEFTHEAHIQMQYGVARVYNTVFGDLYLPNSMQPTWFIEGLAVMMETYRTTRGRIRSPYYRMVMRTHSLEGKFLDLAGVSNNTLEYPRGNADYIYGSMFLRYLRDRVGEEKIFEICHAYASKPIPYGLNRIFLEVTGNSLAELYQDFTEQTHAEAVAVQQQIRNEGETVSERLTFTGESKGHPVFDGGTGRLLVPLGDGLTRSAVAAWPLDSVGKAESRRDLVFASSDASVSIDNGGNMYYVRSAPFKDEYSYRDVFVLPNGARAPRRLTTGVRVKEAAVTPDGRFVAMVTNAAGISRLELMDVGTGKRELLLPVNDDWHSYSPTFSPDGKTLAFVWRQKGRVDVALMDMETRNAYFATRDDAIEQGLRFSADGRYLLFSSGVTGIQNIFAREMQSGALKQLTNVVSGANLPALSDDGRTLYFLNFYSEGWDLHRTSVDIDSLPFFEPPSETHVHARELTPTTFKKDAYNPLPTFRPYSWEIKSQNTGGERTLDISTVIEDAARLHSMLLNYSYEFTAQQPTFSAAYGYSGLLPRFQMSFAYSARKVDSGYLVEGMPATWTRVSWSSEIGLSIPLMALDDNHQLSVGYSINHSAPREDLTVTVDPNGDLPQMPTQYFRTGIRFGWSYSNLFSGPYSISREDGRSMYLGVTLYNPLFGGNREQTSFYWAWREYRQAPWALHHVLALEMEGQAHISNPNHQSSIGAGGYSNQEILDAVMNERSVGLPMIRGYRTNFTSGDHFQTLRLEYRFPLWQAQLAYQTLPFFFSRVYAGVFMDNLLISYSQFHRDDYYSAAGMELVWSFFIGYHMPVILRTGYAHGFMEQGGNEFIMVVGGSF